MREGVLLAVLFFTLRAGFRSYARIKKGRGRWKHLLYDAATAHRTACRGQAAGLVATADVQPAARRWNSARGCRLKKIEPVRLRKLPVAALLVVSMRAESSRSSRTVHSTN